MAAVNVYPGQTNMGHLFFRVSDPERKQFLINTNCILGDYLETLNVQLLNGTTFQDYPNDSTKVLILTNALRRFWDLTHPFLQQDNQSSCAETKI